MTLFPTSRGIFGGLRDEGGCALQFGSEDADMIYEDGGSLLPASRFASAKGTKSPSADGCVK